MRILPQRLHDAPDHSVKLCDVPVVRTERRRWHTRDTSSEPIGVKKDSLQQHPPGNLPKDGFLIFVQIRAVCVWLEKFVVAGVGPMNILKW